MGRVHRPALIALAIPLGMFGGALLGLLLGFYAVPTRAPLSASDPNDGPAMLGVFLMFGGAAAGMLVGIVVSLILYLIHRREPRLR